MPFTYTSNPAAVRLDAIRLLIGDTDSTRPLFQDSEIAWAEALTPVDALAAAQLADVLAAKYASKVDKQIGDLKIAFSAAGKQYHQLAVTLRLNAWRNPLLLIQSAPYAGGLLIQERIDEASDTDKTHPSFKRGMDDYVTDAGSSASLVSPIP